MNETAHSENAGEETPVAAVPSCIVTRILGRCEVDGAKAVGSGRNNTTRWIFDVEAPGGDDIKVTLVQHFGKRNVQRLDLYSTTLTPMSASFYDARPMVEAKEDEHGDHQLVISSTRCSGGFQMRVTVDTMGQR